MAPAHLSGLCSSSNFSVPQTHQALCHPRTWHLPCFLPGVYSPLRFVSGTLLPIIHFSAQMSAPQRPSLTPPFNVLPDTASPFDSFHGAYPVYTTRIHVTPFSLSGSARWDIRSYRTKSTSSLDLQNLQWCQHIVGTPYIFVK